MLPPRRLRCEACVGDLVD
uniref:Uncharacterized protein n=1 Tax=Arundo donax TaxID=35708 RepID=A0A0A9EZU5_ARUDO